MRVLRSKTPFLPYVFNVIPFSELKSVENQQIENLLGDNNEHEPISEAFNNFVFRHIKAGRERTVVILRAEGLSYREIAWVMGVKLQEVNGIFLRVKRRLAHVDARKHLTLNNLTKNPYHL